MSHHSVAILIVVFKAFDVNQVSAFGAPVGNVESLCFMALCHPYTVLTYYFTNVTTLINIDIS